MMTLADLEKNYATEDECYAELVKTRWPDGVRCPQCGNDKVYKIAKPWRWMCKAKTDKHAVGYRFSPLVGTIFENTNVPLVTWFKVMYWVTQSKKGISALQVQRMIGKQQLKKGKPRGTKKNNELEGDYKTAWYMVHRIRAAMMNDEFRKLTGTVEMDETYVGGDGRNRHRSKQRRFKGKAFGGKVGVIGAISRKGNVTARVIEHMDTDTAQKFVDETVASAVNLVATDEHAAYQNVYWNPLQKHEWVTHRQGEYVRGQVHTANLDAFWSLLKRGIMGTFHNVSKKYLPLYVNEFTFRHNHRKNPDIFRAVLAGC